MREDVAIVGAGLVGCLLACFLARRGHQVTLYERRQDPREAGAERGRSINLALSERGLDALRRLGLDDKVLGEAIAMPGRMMHAVDGTLTFQPYSADGRRAINSISRGDLNRVLLDAAESLPTVRVEFGRKLTDLDADAGTLTFEDGGTASAGLVFGADGAYSAVRALAGMPATRDQLGHGYKELTIPAPHPFETGALHIWPRGSSMMIALPNPDGSLTCTLFWPKEDFDALDTPERVKEHFAEVYPDAQALMPDLAREYAANPVGSLLTVYCAPWVRRGARMTVALIGDAAHAIVPFYGQGANCGFEDCVELDRCLSEAASFDAALTLFERRRKDNADTIARLALDNFVEMRDKVASRAFLARKKAEHLLERLFPGRYVSRYELISFTTVPYAEVERRIARQNRWVLGVAGALVTAVGALVLRARSAAPARRGRRKAR